MLALCEGPPLPIEKLYSVILNTVFVTMLYAGGMPMLTWFGMANLAVTYAITKFMILKHWHLPPAYDGKLAKMVATFMFVRNGSVPQKTPPPNN